MATHGMIDLETLGVEPDSVIMTVGAIKFDPYVDTEPFQGLYLRLDVDQQTQLGRSVDDNTLAWWSKQKESVREEAFGDEGRVSLEQFIKKLNKWCVGLDNVWCQGPTFDFVILQHFYKMMGQPVPWNYWQIRDSRTVFSMMPQDPRKAIQEELHNALADCYYQAKCVQQSYKHFGVKK